MKSAAEIRLGFTDQALSVSCPVFGSGHPDQLLQGVEAVELRGAGVR